MIPTRPRARVLIISPTSGLFRPRGSDSLVHHGTGHPHGQGRWCL